MKNALIVGYGISGEGSARLLEKQGYKVSVYDDDKNVACSRCNVSFCDDWTAVGDKDLVVVSPAVSPEHHTVAFARKCGIPVIGEIELGFRCCPAEIVAVTGTNGKTSVVSFLEQLLGRAGVRARALGNIGASFCGELADRDVTEGEMIVLEVSSFQLETTVDFRSRYAVCLNVTPDHLERHGTVRRYAAAKAKLFVNQTAADFAILNYDDGTVRNFAGGLRSDIFYFSAEQRVRGVYVRGGNIVFENRERHVVCPSADAERYGKHYLSDFLAAVLVAKLIGIGDELIAAAIADFRPPRYRRQYLGTYDGIAYYNDSKATNIDSTLKACATMDGATALIVGGYDKGISYEGFFHALPPDVRHIVACGDNVYAMMEFLPPYRDFTYEIASTLERAVAIARSKNVKNILFSPTTSSFDRYDGYVQRGEHFDRIVEEIAHEKRA